MDEHKWNERYKAGDLPWDTGTPDEHLVELVGAYGIGPCRALELGCGAGTNVIWLAENGFEATGVDLAPTAIDMAKERAAATGATGATCSFLVGDVLRLDFPGQRFGFVFDRGCFHSFDSDEERAKVAEVASHHLAEGGLWLSIIGSTDGGPRDTGPPRRSARDIVTAVEERFEILLLKATRFSSARADPPQAWECLMRRRG